MHLPESMSKGHSLSLPVKLAVNLATCPRRLYINYYGINVVCSGMVVPNRPTLARLAALIEQGSLKVVNDEIFEWEHDIEALEK